MPRRKQHCPQHVDGEEEMDNKCTGEQGINADVEAQKISDDNSSKVTKEQPSSPNLDTGVDNGGVITDGQTASQVSGVISKSTEPINMSSPAVITNADWFGVKAALQALQQQQQMVHISLLQNMQTMMAANAKNSICNDGCSVSVSGESDTRDNQNEPEEDNPTFEGEGIYPPDRSLNSTCNDENMEGEPSGYDCSDCDEVLPTKADFRTHMLNHRSDSRSTNCNKTDDSDMRLAVGHAEAAADQMGCPAIVDDKDPVESMEEFMEIQKSENNQIEHLVRNMGTAGADPNQCLICKRVLSCKSALQMHYRTHTGERPFKCKLCSRAFTTKGNLKTHMGVHRAKPSLRLLHTCPVCSKQFTNALVLNQHMRQHSDESVRKRALELSSSAAFAKRSKLADQTDSDAMKDEPADDSSSATLHEPSHSNFLAGLPFLGGLPAMQDPLRYADALARHWEQLSQFSLFSPMPTPSFFPTMLSNPGLGAFPTHHTHHLHNAAPEVAAAEEDCDGDSNESANPQYCNSNQEPHQSRTSSVSSLCHDSSVQSAHNTKSVADNPSPRSERSCMSNDTSQDVPGHRLDPPPGTTCDICSKTFACRSALEIHYRSHTKHRPFKCELCDKAFTTRGNMKQHLLTHKTDDFHWKMADKSPESSQIVGLVGGVSAQTNLLSIEDSLAKRAGNRHQCSVCNKTFSSASALQIHFRTHTGDRPFKCSVCGKAFTTKGNLKVHMGTHMWTNSTSRRGRRLSIENPDSHHRSAQDSGTTLTSPNGLSSLNNNSLVWNNMNPAAFMKASLLSNPAAMLAGYSSMFNNHLPKTDDPSKPWLWHVTCHICNKECESPAALEIHIKTHVLSENGSSKPVTAS